MNALERVTDLLAAVVLLFLLPLLYYGSGERILRAMTAGQAGENFLKRVSTAGEITLPVWRELEAALANCGCINFELQRERRLYEPVGKDGEVVEQTYIENRKGLQEEISAYGKSQLQQGDRLCLTLYVNDMPMLCGEYVRTGGVNP